MNVRELMGRLYCPSMTYGIGFGGIPELTRQDIAAAVGMVKDSLARETFCAIWWPEGAASNVHKRLLDTVLTEYCRLAKAASIAKLDLHIVESELSTKNRLTGEEKSHLASKRAKAAQAHEKSWPGTMKMYPKIISAVINEIQNPKLCTACKGRGTVTSGALVKPCEKCNGVGTQKETHVWRATVLGIKESAYRKAWGIVYTWVFSEVSRLESTAAVQINHSVRHECSLQEVA